MMCCASYLPCLTLSPVVSTSYSLYPRPEPAPSVQGMSAVIPLSIESILCHKAQVKILTVNITISYS